MKHVVGVAIGGTFTHCVVAGVAVGGTGSGGTVVMSERVTTATLQPSKGRLHGGSTGCS